MFYSTISYCRKVPELAVVRFLHDMELLEGFAGKYISTFDKDSKKLFNKKIPDKKGF